MDHNYYNDATCCDLQSAWTVRSPISSTSSSDVWSSCEHLSGASRLRLRCLSFSLCSFPLLTLPRAFSSLAAAKSWCSKSAWKTTQNPFAKWSHQCVSMMSQQESIPATWGTRHKALRRSILHVAGNTCCKAILCGHKWAAMNGWTILPSPYPCGLLAWDWISCCLSRVTRWRFHHKISQTIWWKLPQFLYARLPEWQHCRPAKWKQVCCKYEPAFGYLSNYFHLYLPWNKLQLHGEMLYSEARKCPIRTQNHYVNSFISVCIYIYTYICLHKYIRSWRLSSILMPRSMPGCSYDTGQLQNGSLTHDLWP